MKGRKMASQKEKTWTRREFMGSFAATAATISFLPRHVLGGPGRKAPSDKLNIACVGVGGKGATDVRACASENVIALCDVDLNRASQLFELDNMNAFQLFPKAKVYVDFRRMLDKEKNIDAITVSTPDHTHAVIALMAMKRGIHAFVQKPLTKTVQEARTLQKAAETYKVVTQMGNQGHAGEGNRLIKEWIDDGAIGMVHEVHCWTNRPVWPQAIDRPEEIPSVPPSLDWNLWLGPAPFRPYHPAYVPFSWRGWLDFGVGALGDMGAHIMDTPFWALNLVYPHTIQATSTKLYQETYPQASIIEYKFPARGSLPPVTLKWYDGGIEPSRPLDLEPGRVMGNRDGGVLLEGDKGTIMCGCYGANPRLIPETKMRDYQQPEKTIPRSLGIMEEWIDAIKNGKKSTTDFSYSAPMTETMLLGNIAILMKDHNTILEYDAEKMEFINLPEANTLLHYEYRKGWELA